MGKTWRINSWLQMEILFSLEKLNCFITFCLDRKFLRLFFIMSRLWKWKLASPNIISILLKEGFGLRFNFFYEGSYLGCSFRWMWNGNANREVNGHLFIYCFLLVLGVGNLPSFVTQIPFPNSKVKHSRTHADCPQIFGLRLCGPTGG